MATPRCPPTIPATRFPTLGPPCPKPALRWRPTASILALVSVGMAGMATKEQIGNIWQPPFTDLVKFYQQTSTESPLQDFKCDFTSKPIEAIEALEKKKKYSIGETWRNNPLSSSNQASRRWKWCRALTSWPVRTSPWPGKHRPLRRLPRTLRRKCWRKAPLLPRPRLWPTASCRYLAHHGMKINEPQVGKANRSFESRQLLGLAYDMRWYEKKQPKLHKGGLDAKVIALLCRSP